MEDLRARQTGLAVVLQFTLPRHAVDGTNLEGAWRVQIYRQFGAAVAGAQQAAELAGPPVYSLAADTLSNYLTGDAVTFSDSLSPEEFEAHRGGRVLYRVRTGVNGGSWSGQSNIAAVSLAAPPRPVTGLSAIVTRGAITLRWTPPELGPSPAPAAYIVYRAEVKPGETTPAAPAPVGVTVDPAYHDADVQPGASYRYTVRSLARGAEGEVESADSAALVVRVQEEFAPAPPAGLVAVAVRNASGSLEVDISWAIGGETSVAGYNIYRSEQSGERGERLNRQPVAATAFRDTTVVPGRTYSYSVTTVNLAGQESEAGAPALVTVPPPDRAPYGTRFRPRRKLNPGGEGRNVVARPEHVRRLQTCEVST